MMVLNVYGMIHIIVKKNFGQYMIKYDEIRLKYNSNVQFIDIYTKISSLYNHINKPYISILIIYTIKK